MSDTVWCVYMLVCCNNTRTYIGASNDPIRRLRCHNGELSGGAKSTRTSRPWKHIFIIENMDKQDALQLEWRLKRWCSPTTGKITNCPGVKNRTRNLFDVLNLDRWTSNAKYSCDVPLHIKFYIENDIIRENISNIPNHISYEIIKQ